MLKLCGSEGCLFCLLCLAEFFDTVFFLGGGGYTTDIFIDFCVLSAFIQDREKI